MQRAGESVLSEGTAHQVPGNRLHNSKKREPEKWGREAGEGGLTLMDRSNRTGPSAQ